MACDFLLTRFVHCNRVANKVAHKLARLVKFLQLGIGLRSLWRILYLFLFFQKGGLPRPLHQNDAYGHIIDNQKVQHKT